MNVLSCPAKINLFLAIKGRDSNGYHEIETILHRTDKLQDFIYIEESEEFSLDCGDIPADENNTIVKAVKILEQESGRKLNYKIRVEKNIPPKSGLGGGSSNAAAVLIFLNEHEGLKITHERLMELAAQIGMDVPFFVSGFDTALATHYGEKVSELPALPEDLDFEIKFSNIEISTKDAYTAWDEKKQISNAESSKIIEAIKSQDAKSILENIHNDFESTFPMRDSYLDENDSLLLSGSGGAFVFFRLKSSYTQKIQK